MRITTSNGGGTVTIRSVATLFDLSDEIAIEDPRITCPHCRGAGTIRASEANHRSTDPGTSKRAGQAHQEGSRFGRESLQARVLATIAGRDLTAQECALEIHGDDAPVSAVEGTRRRVSSLRRLNLIRPSGSERTNPGSATPSIVWTVSESGLEVLRKIRETGWSE